MTPLPSLFDKMVEAAKRSKRSTSVQLRSKVGDDPFALSPIREVLEVPSPNPVRVQNVQQSSDVLTEVEIEPESVVDQVSATTDGMDFEDTPIVSEPADPAPPPAPIVPPPAPASVSPPAHEEVSISHLPSNQPRIYPGLPTVP